ncbi:MAG: hypothetical protein PHI13_06000 [Methylococcales bacterium]|nr:hypothetical protein [Methylococcales bacterium]
MIAHQAIRMTNPVKPRTKALFFLSHERVFARGHGAQAGMRTLSGESERRAGDGGGGPSQFSHKKFIDVL